MALGHDGALLALASGRSPGGIPSAGSSPSAVVGMRLVGALPHSTVSGASQLSGLTNYMLGADRSRWHLGIPSFARVRYQGVYPGIDMVYHGNQNELEYDLVVAPGSDPAQIGIAYHGATRLSTVDGALLIHAPGGTILQRRPVIYQGSGSERRLIAGHYVLENGGTRIGFQIGTYDRSQPLVIDPSISYSTFLGGYNASVGNVTSTTLANGIAVDSSGHAFVVGYTDSVAPYPFPTSPGAYQTTLNPGGPPRDAFVTELNPAGNGVVYSTYLGGGGEDRATGVAVAPNGNAYVSGFTTNGTFPTTTGAYQTTYGGGSRDGFFTELNASGTALVYSTLVGGSGTDTATRIAVDSSSDAYVVGNTTSTNLPTSAGALQTTYGGGGDAFVAKISPNGGGAADLQYSTYLGGSAADTGASIALDSAKEAYVTGGTNSANEFGAFDTTAYGAFQPALKGGANGDAYVAKLSAGGTALLGATFLGGTGDPLAGGDSGAGIGLDSSGNAYVTGTAASTDFPVTAGAVQPQNASAPGTNADDSFVTKLAPDLKSLGYSTYYGSITYDTGTDIAVDPAGNAYAVGYTLGSFPLKNPVQVRTGDYDSHLTKFDPSGNVVYSTIYGGGARDFINGVAVDSAGNAYIAGRTDFFSPNSFPIKNAFQPLNGGFANGFVAKIIASPTAVLVNSLRSRGGPVVGGTTVVLTGIGFTGASAVSFGGTAAASVSVNSDTQITAISPPHAVGQVNVSVTAPGGTSPANPVTVYEYGEGLWSLTGSLNTVHYDQQMTLLNDGRVLLVGGQNSMFGNTIANTETYSPLTGAWTATGSLNTARSAYTLTRLDGPACRSASPPSYCGNVLVAGGSPNNAGSGSTALNSAEIYNPGTGAWTFTGNLNTAREQAAATVLDGPECHAASPPAYCGEVLVSGGFNANATTYNTAELYNPATGTWSNTGSFQHTARLFQSVLLPNGKVLIAGGTGSDPTATEIYNPAAGTWSTTASMNIGRQRNTLILLQNGRVLAASGTPQADPPQLGTPQQAGDSAEIYDPSTGAWTLVPSRLYGATRDNHDTAVLPSGEVLLADGGRGGLTSELFNPATNTFASGGLLNISRGSGNPQSGSFYAVVLSSDPNSFAANSAVCGSNCGKVLVAGNSDTATAELYTPAPGVDGFAPLVGADTGGTSVSITGLGFTHNVRSVLFGSTPAASFTVNSYGQITAVAPPGSGSVAISVVNDGGEATSAGTFAYQAGSVTPPPVITVTTQPASKLTVSSAVLNGLIGTRGTATTWQFQYGRTTSYGSGTPNQTIPPGKATVSVSSTVTHLSPLATYHFRLVGLTGSGSELKSVYGRDLTFTTNATGRLLLNHAKLFVKRGVVSASFTCSSSVSCTSKLSITTRARLSKSKKLATVVCGTTKRFFKIRAHKRLTVRTNVRPACMTLLGKARHHSIGAKLTANPRTGQHAVIRKVVLVR